jgi:hypothetical protein
VDPVGTGGDHGGGRQDRGKIAVFDEVVLGQSDIVETVVFAPRDLIEDFAVEPIGWLAPLCWGCGSRTKGRSGFFAYHCS